MPTIRLCDTAHHGGEVRDGLTVNYPVSEQQQEGQQRGLNTERQMSATALFTHLTETLVESKRYMIRTGGRGAICKNNS